MTVTKGNYEYEEHGQSRIEWWIESATLTNRGIRINELRDQDRFLTWEVYRTRVEESDNPLAQLLLDRIMPVVNSGKFCGRISVRSLDDLYGGMSAERFIHFLNTFIVGTLLHHLSTQP